MIVGENKMRIGLTGYQGKVGQAILRNPQGLDIAPIKCNILDLDAVHSEIKNNCTAKFTS